jgi:hypothetical protein
MARMNTEAQKVQNRPFSPVAAVIALPFLFFVFRFTAAAAIVAVVLLYIFFPLHRSRQAIIAA